jgi:biopolymer transport protein ExbB/TolQ
MKSSKSTAKQVRRPSTTLAAFLLGLPLAAAILGFFQFGPQYDLLPADSEIARYFKHDVEKVEVVLFCMAMGTLLAKLWQIRRERAACRRDVVPKWDGKAVAVEEAVPLFANLNKLPRGLQRTYLVQRVSAVLDFLVQRRNADDLDDHVRTLADNDGAVLEQSFALTRFITWAIPILGFLGTVLGITGAIAGITPDVLEHDLNKVTDGLSYSFDATALALSLTMVTMFCSFLVERFEQGVLEDVDRVIDRELAHRWIRYTAESGPFISAVQQNSQVLLDATGRLVTMQAEIWARALAETERRTQEANAGQVQRMTASLEAAMEQTVTGHAQRLAAIEKQTFDQSARLMEQLAVLANAVRDTGREQQAAIVRFSDSMAAQALALNQLQKNEQHLLQLQKALHQNLSAIAGAGSFEQAMHSLVAAVHLLTARAAAAPMIDGGGEANPATLRLQHGKAA